MSNTTSGTVADPEPGGRGEVCEPAFLLAGDHLDVHTGARPNGVDERRTVRGDPQPRRTDGRDRAVAPFRLASSAMPAIASTVRSIASGSRQPGLVETFAEPRDLGAVDDRPPLAVRAARSPTWNLTEFVPTSMTAYRAHRTRRSALSPRARFDVRAPDEPELPHGRDHELRILAIRRRSCAIVPRVGARPRYLRHAAVDQVVRRAACAPRPPAGPDSDATISSTSSRACTRCEQAAELRHRVLSSTSRRLPPRAGTCAFRTGLHSSRPSSFDVLEMFHVHQLVANLDRRVGLQRQQVQLVALLHARRAEARRATRPRARSARRTCAIPSAARSIGGVTSPRSPLSRST